ncbi:hypothetical protein ACS3QZ_16430 [Shimia sp. W99]|uniref:Uncharacterized protein n=1 Tax=Shimia aestuarii TaxID=254406 RepID=A0A1I4MLU2_9RHOB|nr:hypothetical protein [Shimia aestuarii]SFM04234.1 hypothetical protein SAMN04488042_103148 [Shimia aestuarii]
MQPRHFITTVLAAAIAITGLTAAKAHAGPDADDIAKVLFGTAAIVIIGKALEDENKKKKRRQVYDAPTRRYEPARDPYNPYATPRPAPRGNPHRFNRELPLACKRDYWTTSGEPVRGFGVRCLSRSGFPTAHLPRSCEREVETRRGYGTIYKAGCLRRSGYRVSRR